MNSGRKKGRGNANWVEPSLSQPSAVAQGFVHTQFQLSKEADSKVLEVMTLITFKKDNGRWWIVSSQNTVLPAQNPEHSR